MATAVACTPNGAPELAALTDQVAQVGTELKIDLNGSDPDGDQLTYTFRAASLEDITQYARITVSPSGAGVFRWTPLAQDVGEHAFDFVVTDGDNDTTVTINVDVRSAVGSATAPLFRQPLGTGTTVDLSVRQCVAFDVVVEDQDTAQVTLALEEPVAEGMRLDQESGLSGKFNWCPTREQAAEGRFTVVISANDGDNPKSIKNYLVVLRGGDAQNNCPGQAPAIAHTPQNESSILPLTIDATVTDDMGLKEAPLFYYASTNPGATPDLGSMTQLSTLKISGTNTNGVYAADVPNPVAGMPSGTTATLYYLFVADDDDDDMGNCDHSTQSQVFQMTITSTGSANLPLCAACTSDAQCGTGDLCTYVGNMGESYCLQACGAGCPSGYACSAQDIWSVDGATARQCVPTNGSCTMPTAACVDDMNEDDDDRTQAAANAAVDGPLPDGGVDGISCPKPVQPSFGSKADDDWRQLVITQDTQVDMLLLGDGNSDLDLQIYTSSGSLVSKSTTLTADENIIKCLAPATYYVKVNGFTNARSEYILFYTPAVQSCSCVDDGREDDNTYSQARTISTLPHTSTANKICPNNDDWYKVTIQGNKKLIIDVTFAQAGITQDLDVHLYESNGFIDMWPCSPTDFTECSDARGQSVDANEHAEFTAPSTCGTTGCVYYVVVRGWDGASNSYDISLKVQ